MRSMTHREYLTRIAWLENEWSTPNRSDYYLMQIAQEVRRVLSKNPNRIKLKGFEIKFIPDEPSKKKASSNKGPSSKDTWLGILEGVKDRDDRETPSKIDR